MGDIVLSTQKMLSYFFQLLMPAVINNQNADDCSSIRGHSRNRPKGGRNSPQRYTSSCFSDQFSQFMLTTSHDASSKNSICCILYEKSLKPLR